MLIFLFHLLIKAQLLLELQLLLTAVLWLEVTCALISPTPSLPSSSVSELNSGTLSPKRCQETSSLLTGTRTIQSSVSQTGNSNMSTISPKSQHRKGNMIRSPRLSFNSLDHLSFLVILKKMKNIISFLSEIFHFSFFRFHQNN